MHKSSIKDTPVINFKNKINKRAQFFLLAAVIISVVVLSLGIAANRATVNQEPGNFYDFSYEVKREVNAILDYDIYTDFDSDANLDRFVDLLAEDIIDKNPDANFKFIYGNNENLVERDFTDDGANANTVSRLCMGNSCKEIEGTAADFHGKASDKKYNATDIGDNDTFSVNVGGNDFSFPISKYKQVVFIMQKDVEDESFIAVE